MFASPAEIQHVFEDQGYICQPDVATVLYLSIELKKPLLVEGPAGVGKTDLAKVLAAAQGLELIRLQCYEGLDETKALYEWEYAKQLLYTQILKEKIGAALDDCRTLWEAVERIAREESAFFSDRFLVPRPLLKAILADRPTVLLVDEVDKSDPEFEAFLLEVLSEFQVSIPESGTIRARHIPQVILTSNNSRELGDGLKRRCLYLFIDYPSFEQESRILKKKVPDIGERLLAQVVEAVHAVRKLDLRKAPSIGETLDWARSLLLLHADRLDPRIVRLTLPALVKHPEDQKQVLEKIGIWLPANREPA